MSRSLMIGCSVLLCGACSRGPVPTTETNNLYDVNNPDNFTAETEIEVESFDYSTVHSIAGMIQVIDDNANGLFDAFVLIETTDGNDTTLMRGRTDTTGQLMVNLTTLSSQSMVRVTVSKPFYRTTILDVPVDAIGENLEVGLPLDVQEDDQVDEDLE